MRVRDERKRGWFWADNEIIDRYAAQVGPIGVAIYVYLARHANAEGVCWPSLNHISRTLGITLPTARKYLEELQVARLVEMQARTDSAGDPTTYLFTLLRVQGVLNDVDHPLNDVEEGTKARLGGVLNDVSPKKTKHEQDLENKTPLTPKAKPEPTTAALPTFTFSEEQISLIEALNTRLSGGLTVNPTILAFFRNWFQRGGTASGLREVVEYGLGKNPGVRSLAYFQSALNEWLDAAQGGSPNSKGTSTPPPASRFPTREEQRAETRRRMAAQEERIRLDNPGLWELMQRERAEARQKASA